MTTPYALRTTWERGSLRITTPRDRLGTASVAWLCNECGTRRATTVRHPDDVRAAADARRDHVCPPLPEGWLTAPVDLPCDTCRAYTRARDPRGRPRHPTCPPAPHPSDGPWA